MKDLEIWFDLDDTLCYTRTDHIWETGEAFKFNLKNDPRDYYCKLRPTSRQIFEALKELGYERFYILTNASREYAEAILLEANWPIRFRNLYASEDMRERPLNFQGRRVLIDNQFPESNYDKLKFLDISPREYLQVTAYRGDDTFITEIQNRLVVEDIIDFVKKRS